MKDNSSNIEHSNTEYQPPSVKRWGTVLDLTAGAITGGSGDFFEDNPDNDHSIFPEGLDDE